MYPSVNEKKKLWLLPEKQGQFCDVAKDVVAESLRDFDVWKLEPYKLPLTKSFRFPLHHFSVVLSPFPLVPAIDG